MGQISVSITTTAAQDAKLALVLTWQNKLRAAAGQAAYVDVNDMFRDLGVDSLLALFSGYQEADANAVKAAYAALGPAAQATVKTQLGVTFP